MDWKQRVAEVVWPGRRRERENEDIRIAASNYADKPWSKASRQVYWPELLVALAHVDPDDPNYDFTDPFTVGWENGAGEALEWLRKYRYERPREVSAEVVKALEALVERGYPR